MKKIKKQVFKKTDKGQSTGILKQVKITTGGSKKLPFQNHIGFRKGSRGDGR